MLKLKKYDLEGKELEAVNVDEKLLDIPNNAQSIKDYLVALRKNTRQWSANTKGRGEIAHSNAKPRPQKGTGHARQGCTKTPQYRGGAVVFGPKPKFNQHVRINRKEKRLAIHYLLAQKTLEGKVHFIKLGVLSQPKTKSVSTLLKAMGIENRKVLFLCDAESKIEQNNRNFHLSMRNIPKVSFLPITSFSGYDMIAHQEVVIFDSALDKFQKALGIKS